ncbi:MAG: hypothetical protein HYX53_17570 [Chloroflexi bacterium]|nr:hypothetical protein [Chloroflexota bacterium]
MLDLDLAREEPYESQVYAVLPLALAEIAAAAAEDHPEVAPHEFLLAYLGGSDATFRIFAKQTKADRTITSLLVGVFAGTRTLLERQDGLLEGDFRAYVDDFERALVDGELVSTPTLITLDEWRTYMAADEPRP